MFDLWLLTTFFALLGGRIGFVVAEWTYFQERPFQIQQAWQGGFAYHPALVGGILGVGVWCLWRKRPFIHTLTAFALPFAAMSAFGWFACYLEGCAFGADTTVGILSADLPDTFGVFAVRYQTQLIGIVCSLIVLLLAARFNWSFLHVLFWVSISHLGISFLRGDEAFQLRGLRIDMLSDGFVALVSLILIQYQRNFGKRVTNE